MRKKYDRDKMFAMVSESYKLGLNPVDYCQAKNFPTKVFYRYRQQYIKVYGTSPMPSPNTEAFVALDVEASSMASGLSLEIGSAIRLRFDILPNASYLSELLKALPHASLK